MLELIGFIFSSSIGTIGHFLYEFTNKNSLIGFFFAKDESVWSHLKIGITPILFFSIVEKCKLINNEHVFAIKGASILIFASIIIIFYYLEKLIIKKNIAIYNIILFYVAMFISYLSSFLLLNIINLPKIIIIIGIVILIITIIIYFYSAIFKPTFLIFKDSK